MRGLGVLTDPVTQHVVQVRGGGVVVCVIGQVLLYSCYCSYVIVCETRYVRCGKHKRKLFSEILKYILQITFLLNI